MRLKSALIALTLLAPLAHGDESAEYEYDSATGLVVAPGHRLVVAHCTACHSAKIIIQQGLTLDGWGELIEWMQEEQGLWPIDDESLASILNYLATHYSTDRKHFKTK